MSEYVKQIKQLIDQFGQQVDHLGAGYSKQAEDSCHMLFVRIAKREKDLTDAIQGMLDLWVCICSTKGWDPESYVEYVEARRILNSNGVANGS
jgi:L-asparaginase II